MATQSFRPTPQWGLASLTNYSRAAAFKTFVIYAQANTRTKTYHDVILYPRLLLQVHTHIHEDMDHIHFT